MANYSWAFGYMPWGNVLRQQLYSVVTAPTINVMLGDMVRSGNIWTTTPHGYLLSIEDGSVPDGFRNLLGSVMACFDENMDPCKYIAATEAGNSTIAGYIMVADHPDQLFVAREDFDSNAIDLAEGGELADIVSRTICAGNTTTGRSNQMIDSTSLTETNAKQLVVMYPHPDDTALVADDTPGTSLDEGARWICKINEHHYGTSVGDRDVES